MVNKLFLSFILFIILFIFSYTYKIDNFSVKCTVISDIDTNPKPSYGEDYSGYEYKDLGYGYCVDMDDKITNQLYYKVDNENQCRNYCNNQPKCTSYSYNNLNKECFIEGNKITENDTDPNDNNYIPGTGTSNVTKGNEEIDPIHLPLFTIFYEQDGTPFTGDLQLKIEILKDDDTESITLDNIKLNIINGYTESVQAAGAVATSHPPTHSVIKIKEDLTENSNYNKLLKIIDNYNKDLSINYTMYITETDSNLAPAYKKTIKKIEPQRLDLNKYSTKCKLKANDCNKSFTYGKDLGENDIGGGMGNGSQCGLVCDNISLKHCEPTNNKVTATFKPTIEKRGPEQSPLLKCRSKCTPKGNNLHDCVKNCDVHCGEEWNTESCEEICNSCTNEDCRWNFNKQQQLSKNIPSPVFIRTTQENRMIKVSWIKPTINSNYIITYYIVLILNNSIINVYPVISRDELLDYYITNLKTIPNATYSCAVFSKNMDGISESSNIVYGTIKNDLQGPSQTISISELCNKLSSNKIKCNNTPQCKYDNTLQKCNVYNSDKIYSHEMEYDIKSLLNKNSSILNLGKNYTVYLN